MLKPRRHGFGTSWKSELWLSEWRQQTLERQFLLGSCLPPRVAQIEIYEETPDIQEAVLREEVIRKEVEQDTVEAQETIRREELDVDTQGRPIVDKNTWRILK